MNRTLRALALAAAVAGMGISMPSCPGQQALQQQLESVQAKNAELDRKVQMLTTQVNALKEEVTKTSTLLEQMNTTVTNQDATVKALDTSMKELLTQAQAAAEARAKAAPPSKTLKKKGR